MIFKGIEVFFFVLGVVTTLSIGTVIYYNKQYKFKALTWSTLVIGLFLFLFSMAWSWSSVLEGEPRSASMGLVIFGIPSIIILLLSRKFALKK